MEPIIPIDMICSTLGCGKKRRNAGVSDSGERVWGHQCGRCHSASGKARSRKHIDNETGCANCGWNEAYCDRHRRVKDAGYNIENVVILCPNCHRLAGLGKIEVDHLSISSLLSQRLRLRNGRMGYSKAQ